ncbi:MAG TPA: bifunctional diguanylate cyclase/phosphodiesterase [Xanthobacteraceae bacterium]|nr:bifunctional diguanylate cyclase/phosphodiesterase [Xanthobacteraceae bacterium]
MQFQPRPGRPAERSLLKKPLTPRPGSAMLDAAASAALFSAAKEAAYIWDIATDALLWSANAPDVLGIDSLATVTNGKRFAALLHPESPANRYDGIVDSAARDEGTGVPYELCYRLNTDPAKPRWIEDAGRWFVGPDGRPARAEGVIRLATERHLREEKLKRLAATDALTGEMTRARLLSELSRAIADAEAKRASVGFLIVGIDDLAHVNQSYGFDVADEAIKAVAAQLRSRMRGADLIGRFSDNKFGFVLHECEAEDLPVAAARFVNAVREEPFETSAGLVAISVTAGGVVAPRHARDAGEAVGRALEALDLAKEAGRGAFRAYAPSIESEAARRENLRITDVIVAALNERRVELAFQPVVHAKSRELAFRECLVRLREPNGKEVDTFSIVTVAEKLDLVRLIDHRVLELALAELAAHAELRLSLNVSAATVHDPLWLSALAAMPKGVGSRLIVEITESAAIRDVEATRRFVAKVKSYGCRVAIDDFGAGYTSFRNLRRLGVDMVKIDGSFVANLEHAPDDRVFVRALLELARELGLETVAEWVQSESAAETLAGWGCNYFQGALTGLAETKPVLERKAAAKKAAG